MHPAGGCPGRGVGVGAWMIPSQGGPSDEKGRSAQGWGRASSRWRAGLCAKLEMETCCVTGESGKAKELPPLCTVNDRGHDRRGQQQGRRTRRQGQAISSGACHIPQMDRPLMCHSRSSSPSALAAHRDAARHGTLRLYPLTSGAWGRGQMSPLWVAPLLCRPRVKLQQQRSVIRIQQLAATTV